MSNLFSLYFNSVRILSLAVIHVKWNDLAGGLSLHWYANSSSKSLKGEVGWNHCQNIRGIVAADRLLYEFSGILLTAVIKQGNSVYFTIT